MEAWLADPQLMEPDPDAEYHKIIEIDLNEITEPLLACPNDPDDVRPLSEVQGTAIDEVFIGSCMLNIGNFRAAAEVLKQVDGNLPTRLWVAPPTKMDEHQLTEEGIYNIFGTSGARTEMPGCSLCMGNQARVAPIQPSSLLQLEISRTDSVREQTFIWHLLNSQQSARPWVKFQHGGIYEIYVFDRHNEGRNLPLSEF